MRDHPLTPMRDPSLVRVLQRAEPRPGRAGAGRDCRPRRRRDPRCLCRAAAATASRHAIVDAIEDRDLEAIGEAAADFKLITGGSGIALGLPENFAAAACSSAAARRPPAGDLRRRRGLVGLVLDRDPGASRAHAAARALLRDRPDRRRRGRDVAGQALAWARPLLGDRPILISATAPPEPDSRGAAPARPRTRRRVGRSDIGCGRPRPRGARRSAVRRRRRRDRRGGGPGARRDRIAHRPPDRSRRAVDRESPGSLDEPALALALKSGNFGMPDFFLRAFSELSEERK